MIRLVRAMLWARRGAVITIFLLAVVASAAAASAPLYRAAAARAVLAAELADAPASDRVIGRTWTVRTDPSRSAVVAEQDRARPAFRPGFETVRGTRVEGTVDGADQVNLLARSRVCTQLTIVEGRCATGAHEAMLAAPVAGRRGLRVGSSLTFQAVLVDRVGQLQRVGDAVPLTVVGLYQPPDATAPYWAGRIPSSGGGIAVDTIVVTVETAGLARAPLVEQSSDLIAQPSTFSSFDADALRAIVAEEYAAAPGLDYTVATTIPALLERVAANRRVLTDNLLVAALPLVVLCWYVLYLAISAGVQRRRDEFALAGLRGVPSSTRFWIGSAEYVLPVFVGAPVGYLAALLGLAGSPTAGALLYAALLSSVAALGAVAAGMLAQRAVALAPVPSLLASAQPRRGNGLVALAAAVVLALAATYELRSGATGGLALLAPVLVAAVGALIAVRLVVAFAVRRGGRAVRRGRVGSALRLLPLARRPAQVRLVGLLIVLLAVVGFAAAARDVAETARQARVRTELGATSTLAVSPMPVSALLAAVRGVDPEGRYAAAAARLAGPDGEAMLGLDTTRLVRVALWDPDAALTASEAARLLRPRAPALVGFAGSDIAVTVQSGAQTQVVLTASLATAAGGAVQVTLGETRPGVATYRADAAACAAGCRLIALGIDPRGTTYDVDLTLTALDGRTVAADPSRWRPVPTTVGGSVVETAAGADGLRLTYHGGIRPDTLLMPVTTPVALPALTAGSRPRASSTVDIVGSSDRLPGLGETGVLADLEYLDLSSPTPLVADEPSVWLSPDAPADLPDRLRAAGVIVVAADTYASTLDRLDQGGPALALRFYVGAMIAAAAVGMGAVAVVAGAERDGQAALLRALRMQGLRAAASWWVGLGTQCTIVATAATVGLLAAAAAWWLGRDVVTYFVDTDGGGYAPAWPGLGSTLGLLGAVALALLAVGVGAAWTVHRRVERGWDR